MARKSFEFVIHTPPSPGQPFIEPFPFSDDRIAKLADPPNGRDDYFVFDTVTRGLFLRVTRKSKRFGGQRQQKNGRQHREMFGPFPALTTGKARDAFEKMVGELAQGRDLQTEKRQAKEARRIEAVNDAFTFEAAISQWATAMGRKLKPRSISMTVNNLRNAYPNLLNRPAASIVKKEFMAGYEKYSEKGEEAAARHLLVNVKKVYRWTVRRELLDRNPLDGVEMPPKTPDRDVELDECESRLVWQAAGELAPPARQLIRVLLGSGVRYSEAAKATWDEFSDDLSIWRIPRNRMKGGKQGQVVAVPPLLREELRSLLRRNDTNYVFTTGKLSGPRQKKGAPPVHARLAPAPMTGSTVLKKKLDAALAGRVKTDFHLHDFRRSITGFLARRKFDPLVAEKILSHKTSVKLTTVGRIYNRHEYGEERAEALIMWTEHLAGEAPALPTLPPSPMLFPPPVSTQAEALTPKTREGMAAMLLCDLGVVKANLSLSKFKIVSPRYADHADVFYAAAWMRLLLFQNPRPVVKEGTAEAEGFLSEAESLQGEAAQLRDIAVLERAMGEEESAAEHEERARLREQRAQSMRNQAEDLEDPEASDRSYPVVEKLKGWSAGSEAAEIRGALAEMKEFFREAFGRECAAAAAAYANALSTPQSRVTPAMGRLVARRGPKESTD
jgi:integrase